MTAPARFRLAALPTPLMPAVRLQSAVGGPLLWVKRDDLTGFATAGNKARALEFLVGDALARGCDTLVTGGGAGSNFCAAAATAAQVAGLSCHLVLYGSPPSQAGPNLAAAVAAGAEIRFTGRPEREAIDDWAVPELAATLTAAGRRPYPIPRGGATTIGALGYVEGFQELTGQLDRRGIKPGVIVTATGSGATQAGLVAAALGGGWRIIGATVSRPPDEIRTTVCDLARGCAALLNLPPANQDDCEVVDARGPGHGEASDDGERARRIAFATEGLLLDPVYTAKAFAVALDLLAGDGRSVVFWHTGGLPGALHQLASERPERPERPERSERSAPCPTPI